MVHSLQYKAKKLMGIYSLFLAPMFTRFLVIWRAGLCKARLPQGLKPSWLGFHLQHKACQSTTAPRETEREAGGKD